jgi:hypothetical protein
VYVLSLLCRLVDGEEYDRIYNEDSDLTVLEDTAIILESFLSNLEETRLKEGLDLLQDVKCQV